MPPASQFTAQQLLASGDLIIVPAEPAAQQLRNLHNDNQRNIGQRAWSPANVLTRDQWLRSLWQEAITNGTEDRLLLNTAQEHSLWCEVLRTRRSDADGLTSDDALAELAATAWRLSESYFATASLRRSAVTHDARVFAEWAEGFSRTSAANGFVSRASLESAICASLKKKDLVVPQKLIFAGFEEWSPAQSELLRTLIESGTVVAETSIVAEPHSCRETFTLEAGTEADELLAIAKWIREVIQTRSAATATPRIGVLVPDLDAIRDKVSSAFLQVLSPELRSVSVETTSPPFEIAARRPLKDEPMIAVALDLIRWANHPLSRHSVSALLLSPYLISATAKEKAAKFDACILRSAKLLRPEIELRWLVKELRRRDDTTSIAWPHSLARFLADAKDLQNARSFAQWTEVMRQLLRAAGWPGEQHPTNREIAVSQAWEHALDSVATLDFSGPRVAFEEALRALERQLAQPVSQAITGLAPVQILSPSATAGMTFDALALARATDANWPVLPTANPLIAWQLQASMGMPGTDRSAAMREAHTRTARLVQSANNIVFTFSVTQGENPQRLSPLIEQLKLPRKHVAELLPASADDDYIEPETVEDNEPLPPLPAPHVHGGATILQHQAACGFRAFAEIRLRAQELETKDLGYDARDRGNLLHNVMQRFWSETKTQRELRSMSYEKRRETLSNCIDAFLDRKSANDHGWDDAYLKLQKERLLRLLNIWLSFELQRSDFEVLETELKEEISIGPLDLTIRVDRIDRVDGGAVLIDYKTGSAASATDWEGERPDEPQLPLYSLLTGEDELAGLAFAKVKPGPKMSWQGYAVAPNILPGKDTSRDISALQAEWHNHLTMLAEAFAAGDTSVQPKAYPTTCTFCSQRLLCRLDTAALLDPEDLDEQLEEEPA